LVQPDDIVQIQEFQACSVAQQKFVQIALKKQVPAQAVADVMWLHGEQFDVLGADNR
jgi:hypothetical protein